MSSSTTRSWGARVLAAALLLLTAMLDVAAAPEGAEPAVVRNRVDEAALTTVTLTADAERRLGVETTVVERRAVPRQRTVGGTLVVPPGGAIAVAAPQGGAVLAPHGDVLPPAGTRVAKGEPLLRLLLVPSGDLTRAREVVAVAEARLTVVTEKAGQVEERGTAKDEAESEVARAEAALAAARARLGLLTGNAALSSSSSSAFAPLTVSSPSDGVIQGYLVGIGQTVPSGSALVEIAALDSLWVRVSVYAGDLGAVDPARDAAVRHLGGSADEFRSASPVSGPPSADPSAATVDLLYVLANYDGSFRPGERVAVTLTLDAAAARLVVPRSAVVHDLNGGAWVYEQTDEHVFVRRRVEIEQVASEVAVVAWGVDPGVRVVSAGAVELFGTEFGAGK